MKGQIKNCVLERVLSVKVREFFQTGREVWRFENWVTEKWENVLGECIRW